MKAALIGAARRRLIQTKTRTRHVDLRRAVSDAYYALFHALAQCCADELVGATRRNRDEWVRVYRAIQHGQAKQQMQMVGKQPRDPKIKAFAMTFERFQELRHAADYDPRPPKYNRESALALVDEAEAAIRGLQDVSVEERRWLATFVLFKDRQ